MNNFKLYAEYYNLLYKDKNYQCEVDHIDSLINKYYSKDSSALLNLLDLGCGTGKHDFLLAEKGYSVTGVDLSPEMVSIARNAKDSSLFKERVEFQQGDIRDVRFDRKFNFVTSLFHVISYQTSNEDLHAAFKTAREHLAVGGIFIFDCWYGPAVLTDRPVVRIKRLENENMHITRIAEPVMYPELNCVDVNYSMFIENKLSEKIEKINECHKMRYLFTPELKELLLQNKLEIINTEEWLTGTSPSYDTWGMCIVAKAI